MRNNFFVFLILSFVLASIISCKDGKVQNKNKDVQELSVLWQEIETMANQVSCEDATDWKILFVGKRNCGVTKSAYVAYSAKNAEYQSLFLQKVAVYTDKQNAFIAKWENSQCLALSPPPPPPKSVECVTGKAKLVY